MTAAARKDGWTRLGGHPVLDFTNTLHGRKRDDARETLTSYVDLVRWTTLAGLVSEAEARGLRDESAEEPKVAAGALRRARRAREALYEVIAARASSERPPEAELLAVNRELHRALGRLRLETGDGGFVLRVPGAAALELPLQRILWSAARLLASDEFARVRECAAETCAWLFLDATRNRSRRWCDGATCGNRARVRRHYERHGRRD